MSIALKRSTIVATFFRCRLLRIKSMNLPQKISLLSFVVSQVVIIVSYIISVQYGHVEACLPYLEGCLNITDAGIYSPEGYVFRGGMITACAFFIVWWGISHQWLKLQLTQQNTKIRIMSALGVVASLGLVVATAVLIPDRKAIAWTPHVIGAMVFFSASFAAQLLMTYLLHRPEIKARISNKSLMSKVLIVAVQGVMIATFLYLELSDGSESIRSAIEWWLALLIALYFLTASWDWQGYKLTASIEHSPAVKGYNATLNTSP